MRKITIILLLLIIPFSVFAQHISGKVTDINKNPLSYVNIGIVGMNRGSISALNGKYQIDIFNVSDEEIIRFSSVGYESVDLKVGELKGQQKFTNNIVLRKRIFKLEEIVVRPNYVEPIFLGSKKKGIYTCVWNEAKKGAEIGTLFYINKSIFIDKFMFHVKVNNCDSIYYRLRIYDGKNKYPQEIINKKDIRFISKVRKGWVSIDISKYNIRLESDFIVTIETLNSWTSDENPVTQLSVRNVDARSFSRKSSMDEWTQFGNQMSFRMKIREY